MNTLDPKLIIEASAGCGKTYRIEQLVLTLLEEGLELKEMIIATFTKAQAEDLKKKIYKRLKSENSKKAKRALQLFDEANISTLHSMAQKILHEKGPDIDYHNDQVATFSLFKNTFASTLRHKVPYDLVSQEQIKLIVNQRGDLLKEIHQNLALKKEFVTASDLIKKLEAVRARFPLNYNEVNREVDRAMPHLLKKYKEGAFTFVELFKCSTWGEKELALVLQNPPYLFPEEGWKKAAPKEAHLSQNLMAAILELNTICQEARLNTTEALIQFCREVRDKEHKDLLVHDDFIFKLNELSLNPEFQAYFKSRYKIAIIDEFQDTDEIQWQIFNRLFDRIYVVGDPKQSIYRFRNADIYTYQSAKETISGKETLDTNWRSDPLLIEKLNRFFLTPTPLFHLPRDNAYLSYQPVKAGKEGSSGRLIAVRGDNDEKFILHMANRILKDKNFSLWACLVNENKTAEKVAKYLSDLSIPYYVQRKTSLSRSIAGISLYQILMAMRKRKSIKAALASPLIGYTDEEIKRLDDLELFEIEKSRFENYQKAFVKGFAVFVSLFENEFLDRLRNDPPLFYEWEALIEEILAWNQENDFDSYYESSLDNQDKRFVGDPKGVKIMTIHGSKGLQFENVFVLGVAEKLRKDEDEETRAEKMRLLYVAMTRAETCVYIAIKPDEDNLFNRYLIHWNNDFERFLRETGCEDEPLNTSVFCYQPPLQLTEPNFKVPVFTDERLLSYTQMKKRGTPLITSLECLLPKGAQMGIFLHEILENLPQFSVEGIQIKGSAYEAYEDEIIKLFDRLFNFPLIKGCALKDLSNKRLMREVPFTYPHEGHLMHGIIDLVIEVDGEIYIVDWKSHALTDFGDDTLNQVVQEENFNLQASIYHEAAKRHFGSVKEVLFVFLRGPGVYRWTP